MVVFSLSYLAGEKKRIDHHEKLSHFISKVLEDTLLESSVLPMRGIKKGRKGLGEILFVGPLLLINLSALCSFLHSPFP